MNDNKPKIIATAYGFFTPKKDIKEESENDNGRDEKEDRGNETPRESDGSQGS